MLGGAYVEGGTTPSEGGDQVSYLVQDPETLDCMHTFQSTKSAEDWVADGQTQPSPFCGLPSAVHMGFRDHLRLMFRSDEYQFGIRERLPLCRNVYVIGHSLGGAMAELFSACVNNAPPADLDVEGDYSMLRWFSNFTTDLNTTSTTTEEEQVAY